MNPKDIVREQLAQIELNYREATTDNPMPMNVIIP